MTARGIAEYQMEALAQPLPHDIHAIVVRERGLPVGFAIRGHDESDASFVTRARANALEGAMTALLRRAWTLPEVRPAPSLSIVICTHERPSLLQRLLAGLTPLLAGDPSPPEVLVVDNAPRSRATQRIVGEFPGVRYVVEPVAGLDVARNTGWRSASGEWIAYLDDDVEVDAGWLAGVRAAVATWPDLGAITGLVLPWSLETEAQRLFERRGGFRRGVVPWYARGRHQESDTLFPVGAGRFGAGCNMVIRRSVLETIGGFDDALDTGAPLPGGGDLDIFFRVLDHGAAIAYEPAMMVRHEHRRDLDGLSRQYHSWGLGFFAFLEAVRTRDQSRRVQVRRMIRWWVADWALTLIRALAGRGPVTADLVMAEGRGALEGWLGEYHRSRDRVHALRRRAT